MVYSKWKMSYLMRVKVPLVSEGKNPKNIQENKKDSILQDGRSNNLQLESRPCGHEETIKLAQRSNEILFQSISYVI